MGRFNKFYITCTLIDLMDLLNVLFSMIIRKRNECACARVSFSDVQPPEVYKSRILNGPI